MVPVVNIGFLFISALDAYQYVVGTCDGLHHPAYPVPFGVLVRPHAWLARSVLNGPHTIPLALLPHYHNTVALGLMYSRSFLVFYRSDSALQHQHM